VDVATYLVPISEKEPAGRSIRWEQDFEDLKEAMRSEYSAEAPKPLDDNGEDEPSVMSDTVRKLEEMHERPTTKQADWGKAIELGTKILLRKSKDLQVVAFMTESWAHLRGLEGICDGLDLLVAMHETFWEDAYPRLVSEEGDPESEVRRGVYECLDEETVLPLRVRSVPLTRVEGAPERSYSFVKYREALATDQKLQRAKPEQQHLFRGYLTSVKFYEAVDQTPRGFYVDLLERIAVCQKTVERLNDQLKVKWLVVKKERPPQLSAILSALEEVEIDAKKLLSRKPAPVVVEPIIPEEGPDDDERFDEEEPERPEAETAVAAAEAPRRRSSKTRTLTSREDALARIVEAAHFLRKEDPSDPASYMVLRALTTGGLYRDDGAFRSGDLPAPATEVRQKLVQLSRNGNGDQWLELLEESELALGRPEGLGWLDLHLYTVRALDALGHQETARACKAILATCLEDHADWLAMELSDGTPVASGTTKEWIEHECQRSRAPVNGNDRSWPNAPTNPAANAGDSSNDSGTSNGSGAAPDPWEEAQALFRAGRLNDAISLTVQAVRQARAGRERFLRTLQQAELCVWSGRLGLALPLLEMLAQRIDDLQLDQWEDGSLCARVLSPLYRCLKGKDDVRAATIYNRLCQIDAGEALLLAGIE
jgi:type VI secretion system ImpA family protein